LFGTACGIREQNIFLAGCLGLTLLVFAHRKLLSAGLYAAGISLPLAISSAVNYFRLGILFPAPKAVAYAGMVSGTTRSGSWLDPFRVFWVKIVDFSAFGLFQNASEFVDYSKEPSTGAYLVGGIVKKSLLQSSPWIALAIVVAFAVWIARNGSDARPRRALRALSLLLLPTLAIFSLAGFRTDGLSFNQRYLLELVPIAAILVALSLDGSHLSPIKVIAGFLIAGILFATTLIAPGRSILHLATLKLPLLLAIVIVLCWAFRTRTGFTHVLGIAVGLCMGWALSMETIDLVASRSIRARNAVVLDSLDRIIPDHSVLFAYWGRQKAAAGPLQMTKDVLILDPWADAGKDAPRLARLLAQDNRRVFVIGTGVPPEILQSIRGTDSLAVVLSNPMLLYEFVQKRSGTSAVFRPQRTWNHSQDIDAHHTFSSNSTEP